VSDVIANFTGYQLYGAGIRVAIANVSDNVEESIMPNCTAYIELAAFVRRQFNAWVIYITPNCSV
jgi:hypothetical protein